MGKVKLVGFLTGTRANLKSGFQSPRRGEHRIQADDKSRELPHWRVPNHPRLCHIHRCYQLHRERNSPYINEMIVLNTWAPLTFLRKRKHKSSLALTATARIPRYEAANYI